MGFIEKIVHGTGGCGIYNSEGILLSMIPLTGFFRSSAFQHDSQCIIDQITICDFDMLVQRTNMYVCPGCYDTDSIPFVS